MTHTDWVPTREAELADLARRWITGVSDAAKQNAFGWETAECTGLAGWRSRTLRVLALCWQSILVSYCMAACRGRLGGFRIEIHFHDEHTPDKRAILSGCNGCLLGYTWGRHSASQNGVQECYAFLSFARRAFLSISVGRR